MTAPDTSTTKLFILDLEFRPRTEYRNGYRQLRKDTTNAAFFTEQRIRLTTSYKQAGFSANFSIQDVRVWGEQDPRSTAGTLQLFEGWVETSLFQNLALRIGRQRIKFDNERLFAENDWRQNGGTHDAINLNYTNNNLKTNLFGAFNQPRGAQNRFFGTAYLPDFHNYKALIAHFFEYHLTAKVSFHLTNASDIFQERQRPNQTHWRFTNGGRITYENSSLFLTFAAFHQFGKTPAGVELNAFYLQPEIKYAARSGFTFRLGLELFSGDDALNPDSRSHSFDALYGVQHRFLGSMDYFTRFPDDLAGAGIVAPYFFISKRINSKWIFRSDYHLFYSQNNYLTPGVVIPVNKFLGFENDLLVTHHLNEFTNLVLGYSFTLPTRSLEQIKNNGLASTSYQDWAFLMITFKPTLLRLEKK